MTIQSKRGKLVAVIERTGEGYRVRRFCIGLEYRSWVLETELDAIGHGELFTNNLEILR